MILIDIIIILNVIWSRNSRRILEWKGLDILIYTRALLHVHAFDMNMEQIRTL